MTVNEGLKTAGSYAISVDGAKLGQGIYFYTLNAGEYKKTLKMVISQ